jgi:SAM-dependent methyltransferase
MKENRFAARLCPVCGSMRSKLLYRQSFEQFSGASLMDGYDVVICQDCGAGFADDIPPQSAFDEYYRDLSKYEDGFTAASEPPPVEPRFRDIAGLLAKFIPTPNSRILEIGCASGGLLKALRDLGYRSLVGSDPSPGCIRAAREFYGIRGFAATVFTVPSPKEPYDFLILTGVMEHIPDLDRAVDQFRRLLRKGGRVYLEVPDASRYEPGLDAPFQEFSVEHINFFSQLSLVNLMRTRGFRLVEAGLTLRPLHEVTCPCTYGVFEHVSEPVAIESDTETLAGLTVYIEGCKLEDARIRKSIEQALHPGERMIVWGTGTHTLRLLATEGLDPSRIAVFVDSNPKYQQQQLRGIPIVNPAELSTRSEPILISSRSSQQAIHSQIRQGLALKNPLILLYGPEGTGYREEVDPELDTCAGGSPSLE